MAQYINKAAVIAEIEKRLSDNKKEIERASHKNLEDYFEGYEDALALLKQQYLDTLEVKEVYECNDVDLNPLFEEMGVEPDSRIALMFKNAFYKSVDNYLDKKENKL